MIHASKMHYESGTKKVLKADRLMDWRARKDFTQKEAATFVGVSLQTYHNAEHGRPIQLLKANRIAKALRIPLSELENLKCQRP
jgi:DNA-binding XRE family transcriptional regulator